MIARHAAANGLPIELVHRVVIRESRYNPRARNGSNLGLMQIKHATARGVGYTGSASGLLDAETNLTYAVRYLAGAYRAAGGNAGRAVAYYASGYHGRGVGARAGRDGAGLALGTADAGDAGRNARYGYRRIRAATAPPTQAVTRRAGRAVPFSPLLSGERVARPKAEPGEGSA